MSGCSKTSVQSQIDEHGGGPRRRYPFPGGAEQAVRVTVFGGVVAADDDAGSRSTLRMNAFETAVRPTRVICFQGDAQLVIVCEPLISALYKHVTIITTGQGIENLHSNPLSRVVLPDQRTADRRTSHPPSRHLVRYCAQTRTGKYERRNACTRRPDSPAMLGGGPRLCPLSHSLSLSSVISRWPENQGEESKMDNTRGNQKPLGKSQSENVATEGNARGREPAGTRRASVVCVRGCGCFCAKSSFRRREDDIDQKLQNSEDLCRRI